MADKPTVLVCAGRLSSDILSTDYLHLHSCVTKRKPTRAGHRRIWVRRLAHPRPAARSRLPNPRVRTLI